MKKLYKILVEHVAPKDSHISIECFLLAENDDVVYNWIDKEKQFGLWSDRDKDGHKYAIYNMAYDIIGEETHKERMLRVKGDLNDEDKDYSDSYYGLTFFAWEEVAENIYSPINYPEALNALGILEEA